ncbi:MAG: hypothetical protein JW797_00265 [Bradymonadales bacterium]|nr:hypothetical protein [Bradymonadales bacterium]
MGLSEGGITFRTYFVDGELPSDYRQLFLEKVYLDRFEPLTVESEEDISYGWVPIHDLLVQQFNSADLYEGSYLLLGMRIDRWALPPALLKALFRRAEQARLLEQKRDHLTRLERGELMEQQRRVLKRQTLPSVRLVDLCWNLERAELRFSSLSRTVNELFTELFEQTFGLRLLPDSPYISALHCRMNDELLGGLVDLKPARFVGE